MNIDDTSKSKLAAIIHLIVMNGIGSDTSQALLHGHSFTANPIACSAALEGSSCIFNVRHHVIHYDCPSYLLSTPSVT